MATGADGAQTLASATVVLADLRDTAALVAAARQAVVAPVLPALEVR